MAYNMISNMANIKIKLTKTQILDALAQYREIHKAEYKNALDVYREDVIEKLQKLLNKAGPANFDSFPVEHNLGLTVPVNCEKEYNQLYTLFKASYEDIIELDMGEATRILNNEWDWAQSASVSNTFYSSRKK